MLNAERFKKEILENSNVVSDFSMSKDKHTIKKCLGVCKDCFFHEAGDHCANIKVKWLLSKYKEVVRLSRLEYELLKYCLCENYEYIVRDEYGALCVFFSKPEKVNSVWEPYENNVNLEPIEKLFFKKLFNFIKCGDCEPTSIKDVLDNCEVVENE